MCLCTRLKVKYKDVDGDRSPGTVSLQNKSTLKNALHHTDVHGHVDVASMNWVLVK